MCLGGWEEGGERDAQMIGSTQGGWIDKSEYMVGGLVPLGIWRRFGTTFICATFCVWNYFQIRG